MAEFRSPGSSQSSARPLQSTGSVSYLGQEFDSDISEDEQHDTTKILKIETENRLEHPPWRVVPGSDDKFTHQSSQGASMFTGGDTLVGVQLQSHGVLQDCPKEFMQELLGTIDQSNYKVGDFIVKKGASMTSMMYMMRGQATIFFDRDCMFPVATLSTGSYFGELSMLGVTTNSEITLQAVEDCWVVAVSSEAFMTCLNSFPDVQSLYEDTWAERHQADSALRESCEILKGLSVTALVEVMSSLVSRMYFPGDYIMLEGAEGSDLYFLEGGLVEVIIGGKVVWKQNGGDKPVCFGELALLGIQKTRTASIVAKTTCWARVLFHSVFLDILDHLSEGLEMERVTKFLTERYQGTNLIKTRMKLRDVDFFQDAGCCEPFLEYLESRCEEKVYLTGQGIIDVNVAEDKSMYILSKGQATVLKDEIAVAELEPGTMFGEALLLGLATKRTTSIVAVSTCYLQVFSQEVVIKALEMHPAERQKMLMTAFIKKNNMERDLAADEANCFPRQISRQSSTMERQSSQDSTVSSPRLGRPPGQKSLMQRRPTTRKATMKRGVSSGHKVLACSFQSMWDVNDPDGQEEPEEDESAMDVWRQSNKMNVIKALAKSKMFSGVDDSFVGALSKAAIDRIYMPGEWIIEEGTSGDSMFILISGKASVCCTQIDQKTKVATKNFIGVLEAGAICGELAMLGVHSRRSATIEAETICCAWEVQHDSAMPIIGRYPDIQNSFLNTIVHNLGHTVPATVDSLKLFEPFGRKFRMLLGLYCDRLAYFHGTQIFRETTQAEGMCILNHGQGLLQSKGTTIATYSPGTPFNVLALFGAKTCLGTLTAHRTCQVIMISRTSWQQALEQYPARKEAQDLQKKETDAHEAFKKNVYRLCNRKTMFKQCTTALFVPGGEEGSSKKPRVDIKQYFFYWKVLTRRSFKLRSQAEHTSTVIDRWVKKKRDEIAGAARSRSPLVKLHRPWAESNAAVAMSFVSHQEAVGPTTPPSSSTASARMPRPVAKPIKHANLFNMYLGSGVEQIARSKTSSPRDQRFWASESKRTPLRRAPSPQEAENLSQAPPWRARDARQPSHSVALPKLMVARNAPEHEMAELWELMGVT